MKLVKPLTAALLCGVITLSNVPIDTPVQAKTVTKKATSKTIKTVTVTNTTIKKKTTYQNKKIDTVIIKGVTSLPKNMFKGSTIKTLQFDNKLKTIGESAFENAKITTMKNNMKQFLTIEKRAFYKFNGSSAKSNATFAPTTVKDDAFYKASFYGLTLNDRIKQIGKRAFERATIQNVTHTQSKQWMNVSSAIFKYAYIQNLKIYANGTDFGREKIYPYAKTKYTVINALNSVTIKEKSFEKFESFDIRLNGKFKKIETYAFLNAKLTPHDRVVVWNSEIDTIGKYAFKNARISDLFVTKPIREIQYGAFYNSDMREINLTMSKGIIGEKTFFNSGLESISLYGDIDIIASGAFAYDNKNKEINPNSIIIDAYVKDLGNVKGDDKNLPVFSSVQNLKMQHVDNINQNAFSFNQPSPNTQHKVIINSNIESIAKQAFTSKFIKAHIAINGSIRLIKSYAFENTNATLIIDPDKEITEVASYGLKSSNFSNEDKRTIISNTQIAQPYAFAQAGLTGSFKITNPNMQIGEYAFYDNNITRLTLPYSITLPAYSFAKNPITDFGKDDEAVYTVHPTAFDPESMNIFNSY